MYVIFNFVVSFSHIIVCICIHVYACMCVCMHACMYICMYVYIYICVYAYVYIKALYKASKYLFIWICA